MLNKNSVISLINPPSITTPNKTINSRVASSNEIICIICQILDDELSLPLTSSSVFVAQIVKSSVPYRQLSLRLRKKTEIVLLVLLLRLLLSINFDNPIRIPSSLWFRVVLVIPSHLLFLLHRIITKLLICFPIPIIRNKLISQRISSYSPLPVRQPNK